ncbi:MAG: hypothetical protein ABL871_05555 [Terricaulis sp.]
MKILLPLALALSLTVAACGQREAEHDMAPAPSTNAANEDADFAMRLVLIEGHLQVGRELMQAGQTQNALPHFGHPVRELYSDMIPIIVHRNGQQFDRDLIALEGLAARENNSQTFRTAFDAALAKVHAARDLIPAEKWASDEFVLGVVADTANVASQEYRNALIGGRVGSFIEYHDARGFIFRLSDILAAHQGTDPRLAQAAAIVAELRVFVEPLTPPNPPRATDVEFEAKAAQLRALVEATHAQ